MFTTSTSIHQVRCQECNKLLLRVKISPSGSVEGVVKCPRCKNLNSF